MAIKNNRKGINSKKIEARKRKSILVLAVTMIIAIGGIAIYSGISLNSKNEQALAENNDDKENIDNKNNSDENDKEGSKLDNSGYLTLENDPNADDAAVVAEKTRGLIKGELQYPVRDDGKKVVYLTFDDGPSTTNTPKVLDILDEYGVKGTFFVTGKSIDASSQTGDILKRVASSGHAIANHSYSHDYTSLYPNRVINVDNFMNEYNKTNQLLKEKLGEDFSNRVVRFPGGYWSWNGRESIRPVLDEEGIEIVDWDALNGDAANGGNKSKGQLVAETKDSVEKLGDKADSVVFLMHDTYGKETTAQALPEIIEYFKSKGYEFRTIK